MFACLAVNPPITVTVHLIHTPHNAQLRFECTVTVF
jgi:hypothetical protein